MAIKFYRLASKLIFVELFLNIFYGFIDKSQCLIDKKNGIMEMYKILQADSIVTTVILTFLFIHYALVNDYRVKNRRRANYYNRIHDIVTGSWIILYCIKFFVLNSAQSVQYFTYMTGYS